MKTKTILSAVLLVTLFAVTSCTIFDVVDNIINGDSNGTAPVPGGDPIPETPNLEKISSGWNYNYFDETQNRAVCPSTGNVTGLVIPVEFKDRDSYSTKKLDALSTCFNGTNDEGYNPYWESVNSFYKKSTNGKLNFKFDICDPFVPNVTADEHLQRSDDYGTETSMILDEVYSKGLTLNDLPVNLKDKKYDSNNDGIIDCIWIIYNEYDRSEVYGKQNFWAYATMYYPDQHSTTAMPFGRYGCCGAAFTYEDDPNGFDAHTLIHESGHIMGLPDYYDYNERNGQFGPAGGLLMMDRNVGDHDSFSKFAENWSEAIVVNEDNTTVDLYPFESSYTSVLLPAGSFNGTAFSEYLMLDFYTPTGVNENIKHGPLQKNPYAKMQTNYGLRIYHVDARLNRADYKGSSIKFGGYLGKDSKTIPLFNPRTGIGYEMNTNNSPAKGGYYSTPNKLLTLVSPKNQDLYKARRIADNRDIFTTIGEVFTPDKMSAYFDKNSFDNKYKFNDGSDMDYRITINSITKEKINITINRG